MQPGEWILLYSAAGTSTAVGIKLIMKLTRLVDAVEGMGKQIGDVVTKGIADHEARKH